MKILMVCLGNICRSPIAEGVMLAKIKKYGLKISVDSAGVLSDHAGESPDSRARAVAGKYGVDISKQKARQFNSTDFSDFDVILTMDESVKFQIQRLAGNETQKAKVVSFLAFSGSIAEAEVPDPYYGGPDGFEFVFRLIDQACEKIAENYSKEI